MLATDYHYKGMQKLKKKFNLDFDDKNQINTQNILNIVIYLMQKVEKYRLSGVSKKQLVINIIKDVILKNKDNIKEYELIEYFIDNTLPSLIDNIISLDRKEIYIKFQNMYKNKCVFF